MSSATRALAASSLLLCAIACAAVALLTIASSATEQLAQQPHFAALASSSSISSLEARVEADAKSAAAKDAGVKSLQAELIKYAQAAQVNPKSKATPQEQNQVKRAEAVQESLTKIAQNRPASMPHDLAGTLVAHVKADDAKVQGAMSALHNALLPPPLHAAAPPKVVVDQKKVDRSVADLTKIALELHLKQLETKQRALHPEAAKPLKFVQNMQQQPLAIHAPGEHMPRAVAAIAKAAKGVPLPRSKAVSSPSDSADAILHRAMANVVKNAMQQKKSPVAAAAPVPSSPSAAAKAILNAAIARAEHNAPAAKTDLSVPFAPLKVPHAVGIDSHALAIAIGNAANFDSRLKADVADVAAAAAAADAASERKKTGGYRVKRGEIEKALNRAVAFENQMEQMIIDEKTEAEKQQQLKPKTIAAADKLALLAQQEKSAQMAAISSALEQAKHRANSYALRLKTLDQHHSDLNAQRAAASAKAAQQRQEDAVAHAVAAAEAAKAAALRADKAQPSGAHTPHAPVMPQAVSHHPSWHLADVDSPISRVKSAEAAATAARAAVVAAEAAAAEKAKAVASAEQHLVQADHAAEEAQAAAASSLAKEYEKKLLEGIKAKAVAAKANVKGVEVEKTMAHPKESELQRAEEALQNILKRQEELNKQKV